MSFADVDPQLSPKVRADHRMLRSGRTLAFKLIEMCVHSIQLTAFLPIFKVQWESMSRAYKTDRERVVGSLTGVTRYLERMRT